MPTAARRYARYRWAIYAKIGVLTYTINGISTLNLLFFGKPCSRHLSLYVSDVTTACENLIAVLREHLHQLKISGAWRQL